MGGDTLPRAEKRLEQYRSRYPDGRFTASARNLAHYLALRHFDLRSLQDSLSDTGISSLGRCEAHVLQTLDQVIRLLGGEPDDATPEVPGGPRAGRDLLAEHTRRILGADPSNRYTRIMVTLPGESAEDYPLIRDLLAAGMNCARINCAHDDPEIWEKLARNVSAQAETGLDAEDLPAHAGAGQCRVHLSPELYGALREGDRLSFRDTRGKQRYINVMAGAGAARPGPSLDAPSCRMVGFSFVETMDDMEQLIEELAQRQASHLAIVAKIETRRAVMNLPDLILGTIGRFPRRDPRGDLARLGGSAWPRFRRKSWRGRPLPLGAQARA
ncbi:MAG: hypothetical protein IPM20_07415 [Gammaproteobacteria bacterium]|nr:hypothetical protein [Gammaproteobacteria bacterium]